MGDQNMTLRLFLFFFFFCCEISPFSPPTLTPSLSSLFLHLLPKRQRPHNQCQSPRAPFNIPYKGKQCAEHKRTSIYSDFFLLFIANF